MISISAEDMRKISYNHKNSNISFNFLFAIYKIALKACNGFYTESFSGCESLDASTIYELTKLGFKCSIRKNSKGQISNIVSWEGEIYDKKN